MSTITEPLVYQHPTEKDWVMAQMVCGHHLAIPKRSPAWGCADTIEGKCFICDDYRMLHPLLIEAVTTSHEICLGEVGGYGETG